MKNKPVQTSLKSELMHLAVIGGMFVASAVCWNRVDDRIPIHWNAKGEVDGWGGRFEGLMLLPLITLGVYGLLRFLPVMDPGRENYHQFARPYTVIRCAMTGLMVVIHTAALAFALKYEPNMGMIVGGSVGVLMIVLGNYMGKIRPNWFVGIRTPWTLSSKLSWTRTHRVGGWLFIGMGLAIGVSAVAKSELAIAMTIGVSITGTLLLVAYSYFVWRKDPNRISPAGTSPASEESDAT